MTTKITGYVYWKPCEYTENGGEFIVCQYDKREWDKTDDLYVTEVEVEFQSIKFDPRSVLVEKLKKDRQKIIDEATKKAAVLEEKIQKLLAITNQVEQ